MSETVFENLNAVATHLREKLDEKKYIVLFAYNGTGKTRLSMEFKDLGKNADDRDTLYFNAFTEDLFSWDNDLDNDAERVLRINGDSRFFIGLQELEMESRIRPLLRRYADFDFVIDYNEWSINFVREVNNGDTTQTIEHIKVSRGEENIFVWCFFLAVAQLAVDGQEAYRWVNYIYIDDPISSLDDNNAIAVASHLAQLLKDQDGDIRVVVSSHHALFFNVIWNELGEKRKQLQPYFLRSDKEAGSYILRYTNSTPFFHHVALLTQLHQAAESGELYTYHFNILRGILEKTAAFHGFKNFSACIKQYDDDPDGVLHARIINILSHGDYSMFEPMEMQEENKGYFRKILSDFMENYRFNPELFPELTTETN
ncbi:AAA family ATPase [Vibrio parahaemolyticus]|uniref:AAA family ATPase n=1 Tax=Vibrio harveyi group TaxID=717610 RepID=UPI0005ABB73A|nr:MULTISPECIES: AAA family ATPase [Vibrio harveyi group]KIP70245.1 anticodon nuclease [Vibrio alginolyticus]KIP82644.1 anticodon nuclease [Vibrio alginolyticus]MBO0177818.1 AAA family ATPase [Vibrio parahaemolyticus]MCR9666435.1 AAA family ATPase [Vibrio parahaemolyticus]MCR9680517.1 AAA family ATPase [Vibrio parahaemolyticus]